MTEIVPTAQQAFGRNSAGMRLLEPAAIAMASRKAQPTPAGFLDLLSKEDQGMVRLTSLRSVGDEVEVVQWQERPNPVEVYRSWQVRAAAGEVTAAALVAAHRDCVGIPASVRLGGAAP